MFIVARVAFGLRDADEGETQRQFVSQEVDPILSDRTRIAGHEYLSFWVSRASSVHQPPHSHQGSVARSHHGSSFFLRIGNSSLLAHHESPRSSLNDPHAHVQEAG